MTFIPYPVVHHTIPDILVVLELLFCHGLELPITVSTAQQHKLSTTLGTSTCNRCNKSRYESGSKPSGSRGALKSTQAALPLAVCFMSATSRDYKEAILQGTSAVG